MGIKGDEEVEEEPEVEGALEVTAMVSKKIPDEVSGWFRANKCNF